MRRKLDLVEAVVPKYFLPFAREIANRPFKRRAISHRTQRACFRTCLAVATGNRAAPTRSGGGIEGRGGRRFAPKS
jgi:hypothetical protein